MSARSKLHVVVLGVYVVLAPVAYLLGWLSSVAFVSLLSVWALVESRLAVLQASRARDEADRG